MKVLMCGNHPSNKGGMTSVISLINGHDWKKENIDFSFVPTYMPGGKGKTILYFGQACFRILFRFLTDRPDVLYTHMSYKGSFTRTRILHQLCRRFGIRDVIHLHGSEFRKWYEACDEKKQKKIRSLITECSCFIVLGENWKQFVSSIAPEANVRVLSNCVKIPDRRVSRTDEACSFLYLGVLIPRKGVEDLVRAVAALKEKGENMHLYIGGTGPSEEALRAQCSAAGLDDTVEFCGWIQGEEKEKLILKSHVFVLPSYNEGLPMAILEAMSYGLPVISTDVGDISAAVRDGVNGFLFEPGDVEALQDRMGKFLADEAGKKLYEDMSRKSREMAEESFSDSGYFQSLAAIYRLAHMS